MSLPDCTELRRRGHPFHRMSAERGRGRRLLPAAHQHSAGLPRRGLRHLQVVLRIRQLRRWGLHRRGDDRRRGRAGLRADLPDGPGIGLHHPHPRHVGRRQDRASPPTRARSPRSTRCPTRPSRSPSRWTTGRRWGSSRASTSTSRCPGTDQARSFSFSSGPSADDVGFLIRNTSHGVLTTYLRDRAQGRRPDRVQRPAGQLLPAGDQAAGAVPGRRHRPGTVPVDAATRSRPTGSDHPVHLIFGVTNDARPGQDGRTGGVRRADAELHLHLLRRRRGQRLPEQGLRHPVHDARST